MPMKGISLKFLCFLLFHDKCIGLYLLKCSGKLGFKKKDVCLSFFDQPKISENMGCFFFFFDTQFCIFLNRIVKIKLSKYIVTVPKVYCVGSEGIVFAPFISPPNCLMSLIKYRKAIWYCISSTSCGSKLQLPVLVLLTSFE